MTDFHELSDSELWAQVDAAWLLEQFRRSEIREERQRQQVMHSPSRQATFVEALFRYFSAAHQELQGLCFGITDQEYAVMLQQGQACACAAPDPAPKPLRAHAPNPHGWTLRPALRDRPRSARCTRPPPRRHQVQHRG